MDYYEGLVVYSITTAESQTITGMGQIPSGYTVKKPGPDQVWKNGEWVDDTNAILAKLYPQKLAEIDNGCSAYIEGGFHSSALGEPHRYSSSLEEGADSALYIRFSFPNLEMEKAEAAAQKPVESF